MTTKQEIIDEGYKVDEYGIIRSLGKFEGEPCYVLHFYYVSQDGCAEIERWCDSVGNTCEAQGENGCEADECPLPSVYVFPISEEDVRLYPELADVKEVRLWERSDGIMESETIEKE